MKKKIVLLLAAAIFALACACSAPKEEGAGGAVMVIDGSEITREEFNYYLAYEKDRLEAESWLTPDELWSGTIEGYPAQAYAKNQTVEKLLGTYAMLHLAAQNDIRLSDEDMLQLREEKENVIATMGRDRFEQSLKETGITEETYDEIMERSIVYARVYEHLYGENGMYAPGREEVERFYFDYYLRGMEIMLPFFDAATGEMMDGGKLEELREYAAELSGRARDGEDFLTLLAQAAGLSRNIQADADETFRPEWSGKDQAVIDAYYSTGVGDVSDVIETEYAFFIIKRLETDAVFLDEFYDAVFVEYANGLFDAAVTGVAGGLKVEYKDGYDDIMVYDPKG